MTESKNPYAVLSGSSEVVAGLPLTTRRRVIWILPFVFFTLSVYGGGTTGPGSPVSLGLPQFIIMDFPNGFPGLVRPTVRWGYLFVAIALASGVSIFVERIFRDSIGRILSSRRLTVSLATVCVLGGFMDQLFPSYDMTAWVLPWLLGTCTAAALISATLGNYRDAFAVSVFTVAATTSCKPLSHMLQGVVVSFGFQETLQLAVFVMMSFAYSSIFVFTRRRFFQHPLS